MSSSGLALGRAVADELDRLDGCRAIVAMQHGLITWGASPKQAYDDTIEMVGRAEEYIEKKRRRVFFVNRATDRETAHARYVKIAPLLRGLLSPPSDNPDSPFNKMILVPLISEEILEILDSPRADELACTAPLTPDYLVRTKPYPLFVEKPDYDDLSNLRRQLAGEIGAFSSRYEAYVKRHSSRLPECDRVRSRPSAAGRPPARPGRRVRGAGHRHGAHRPRHHRAGARRQAHDPRNGRGIPRLDGRAPLRHGIQGVSTRKGCRSRPAAAPGTCRDRHGRGRRDRIGHLRGAAQARVPCCGDGSCGRPSRLPGAQP